jgi:phospholipid/cholesterol/gamma-HCH transport system substrate-binding protein
MEKKISKEVKIGLVTILSLVLLYIGINYLKGINLFKPANYYYVSCYNVKDVNISSPVFVEGFKVGLVRAIEYDYSTVDRIILEVRLDRGMRVNKGSYVSIESSLLSGAELHIRLNKYVTEYLKPGDMMDGRTKQGMLLTVEDNILPGVADLLPKIDSILTGLQALVSNTALTQSLTNLEQTTEQLKAVSLQLHSFLKNDIPELSSSLTATTRNLSTFSQNLNELELDQSIQSLNASLENIHSLTSNLNAPTGTLGLLLNDTSLYNSLNRTLESASGLLNDIKLNPKKYVKLSLF